MLAAERQVRILDEVKRRGSVRVRELSELLQVSDMTIRRDLDALAGQGRLDKVHGGATVKRTASTEEPGFEKKQHQQTDEKEAIAAAAAALVPAGAAIGLSAGTTTWTLARHLGGIADLTVVTNSMRIADTLHSMRSQAPNVVLTGGVRTPSDALVGPVAVASMQLLHLDLVFLGVHGMDLRAGLTTPNLLEADTNRALISAGKRLVVLADHTKWATVGISTMAYLDQVDVVVTDDGLSAEAQEELRAQVGELIVTPAGGQASGDGLAGAG